MKYKALYNLLVDSGLRLTEAVKAINKFSENKLFRVKSGQSRFLQVNPRIFSEPPR